MKPTFAHRLSAAVLVAATTACFAMPAGAQTSTQTRDATIRASMMSRGSLVMLNPQPLPPHPDDRQALRLNPQPLPPHPDDRQALRLNPQPLPPHPDTLRLKLSASQLRFR